MELAGRLAGVVEDDRRQFGIVGLLLPASSRRLGNAWLGYMVMGRTEPSGLRNSTRRSSIAPVVLKLNAVD